MSFKDISIFGSGGGVSVQFDVQFWQKAFILAFL